MNKNLDEMSIEELQNYILVAKKKLGKDLIIPAHHYIPYEVVQVSDFLGDSYKLAVDVSRTSAKYIVFAGVSFMAEGAAILANEGQTVLSPDYSAGCPMADMITAQKALTAHNFISLLQGKEAVPVIYMNSYADSKAFTGEKGGSVCTSSNAKQIVSYYLNKNKSIFFFPDQHLGRNIAAQLPLKEEELALMQQDFTIILASGNKISLTDSLEGISSDLLLEVSKVKIFFWDGFCQLHKKFSNDDISKMKEKYPHSYYIVHPEVPKEVTDNADSFGSTQLIYNRIKNEEDKNDWVIGTELNFVYRIAKEFPEKRILPLHPIACKTMSQITLLKVAKTISMLLNHIEEGTPLEQVVTVDKKVAGDAAKALNKMIEIVEA